MSQTLLVTGATGLIGSAIALVEPVINTIAYFFHEKIWERIRANRETLAEGLPA